MVALRNTLPFTSGPRVPSISEAERELLRRLRSGDAAAFRTFHAEWRPFVFNVSHRLLGNPTEAEDLTQEVFLRVARSIRRFDGGATLKTWLYKITRNAAFTRFRALQSRGHGCHDPIDIYLREGGHRKQFLASKGPNPVEHLLARERGVLADRAIGVLPDLDQEMLRMRHLEGLSDQEIAKKLGLQWQQVKKRFFNMRRALTRIASEPAAVTALGVAAVAILTLPALLEGISSYFNRARS